MLFRLWRLWLILLGCAIALLIAEVAARVWVELRWDDVETYVLTHHTPVKGHFMADPLMGYRLAPNFRRRGGKASHNSYGFRGAEFSQAKASGALRVAMIGASTVYGIYVKDDETASAHLERRLQAVLPDRKVEVLNAGVHGYTSLETRKHFEARVLPLDPDIVVVVDGRNDLFPQVFNDFRPDYSHYRDPNFDFPRTNYWYKHFFRASHLAMLIFTGGPGYLGFSHRLENMTYGSIREENKPTQVDFRRNAAEAARTDTFRRHLGEEVALASGRGARVALVTVPFVVEKYGSNVIYRNEAPLDVVAEVMARNHQITREVAHRSGAALIESGEVTRHAALVVDDCHFNAEGERAFAELILEGIRPMLPQSR